MRNICILLLIFISLTLAGPADAIPAFARKYGFDCSMCHTTWPRLNDFGQKYRLNGYQIPGQEELDKTIWETGVTPIALRTSAGYTSDQFKPNSIQDETSQFQINGLDILSGGLLGENKGYFLAYLPQINGGGNVEPQDASLEQANVAFTHLGKGTLLNARIGKFEGAYLPFSQLRSITISPYEIYAFNGSPGLSISDTTGSDNIFALSDTSTGLELYGWNNSPLQYYIGLTDGSSSNNSNDSPADFYMRGAYTIGQGMGQSGGQRIGATVYYGKAKVPDTGDRESFDRIGLDASLNSGPYNAEIQYIHGNDNGAFNIFSPGDKYKFSGGFIQLNRFEMQSALFMRYDWVNTPSEDNHDITRWTAGWRMRIEQPLMFQIEYSHRQVDNGAGLGSDLSENFIAARVDWAF